MQKDFFLHRNETLKFRVQLLDENNSPIVINDHKIEFATALELDTPTIEIISLEANNGITVLNSNSAIVEVNFMPTSNAGFDDRNLVHQLRTVHKTSGEIDICLEGKIFMTPSLFD